MVSSAPTEWNATSRVTNHAVDERGARAAEVGVGVRHLLREQRVELLAELQHRRRRLGADSASTPCSKEVQ